MQKVLWFLLTVSLPVLDVGSLFLLAHFIGNWSTLGITFVSCSFGLLACFQRYKKIEATNKYLRAQYGIHLPKDILIVQGYEACYEAILMFLFLFPGLLSDIAASFFALPWIRKYYLDTLLNRLNKEAELHGMTLRQYLKVRKRNKLKE